MWCRWIRATDAARFRPLSRLNRLPTSVSPSAARRLEPDEDPRASRPRRQRQQLFVVGEIDRRLRHPFLAEIGRRERPKKGLGAGDVLGPGADQVVVHHQDALLGNRLELPDHLGNGALAVMGAVEGGDAAERAVHGTAARRLDRPEGVVTGEEVVAGRPDRVHFRQAPVVPWLQAPGGGVRQHVWPGGFGLSRDNRVHVRHHFVDAHGGVDPAHHDGHAQAPKAGRDFVGARRLRGERRDADQIRKRLLVVARDPDVLVEQGDVPLGRGQAGQRHQAERLPDAIAVPPALLEPDDADQRIGRVDQVESHGIGTSRGRDAALRPPPPESRPRREAEASITNATRESRRRLFSCAHRVW